MTRDASSATTGVRWRPGEFRRVRRHPAASDGVRQESDGSPVASGRSPTGVRWESGWSPMAVRRRPAASGDVRGSPVGVRGLV